jgi:hypothetical protein
MEQVRGKDRNDPFGPQIGDSYQARPDGIYLVDIAGGNAQLVFKRINPYPGIPIEVPVGERPGHRDFGIINHLLVAHLSDERTRFGAINPILIVRNVLQYRAKPGKIPLQVKNGLQLIKPGFVYRTGVNTDTVLILFKHPGGLRGYAGQRNETNQ